MKKTILLFISFFSLNSFSDSKVPPIPDDKAQATESGLPDAGDCACTKKATAPAKKADADSHKKAPKQVKRKKHDDDDSQAKDKDQDQELATDDHSDDPDSRPNRASSPSSSSNQGTNQSTVQMQEMFAAFMNYVVLAQQRMGSQNQTAFSNQNSQNYLGLPNNQSGAMNFQGNIQGLGNQSVFQNGLQTNNALGPFDNNNYNPLYANSQSLQNFSFPHSNTSTNAYSGLIMGGNGQSNTSNISSLGYGGVVSNTNYGTGYAGQNIYANFTGAGNAQNYPGSLNSMTSPFNNSSSSPFGRTGR